MKSFSRLVLFLTGFFFSLAGCKKDTDFTSYINGTLDGVPFSCTTNIRTNGSNEGAPPQVFVIGDWSVYSIHLIINGEGSNVTTGQHVLQVDKHSSITLFEGQTGYYAGSDDPYNPQHLLGSGKITLTEFSKNYIRGSYEFVSEPRPGTGIIKTISGGGFYIRRG